MTEDDLIGIIKDGLAAPRSTLTVRSEVADILSRWIENPPPYVPPERPEWMRHDTWAVRQLILAAGEDAHWVNLHVYIEDLNLDDWRFDHDDEDFDHEWYASFEPWERAIFDGLANLTESKRYQAVTGQACPAECYDQDIGCPYTSCARPCARS